MTVPNATYAPSVGQNNPLPPTVCEEVVSTLAPIATKILGCAVLVFSALEAPILFAGSAFLIHAIQEQSPNMQREIESITKIFWTSLSDFGKVAVLACCFFFKPISIIPLAIYAGAVFSQMFIEKP